MKSDSAQIGHHANVSVAPAFADEQVQRIRKRLLRWGRANFQLYPWRLESDGWLTLVAEMFLQRTRAEQVKKVYTHFSKRYPTPTALLNDDPCKLSHMMAPLGLAFRAENIRQIARLLVEREGELPETMSELRRFSGVGMYTAAAWLSLHVGTRAVLIDSNVSRWLSRMTGNPYDRDPRHVSWINDLAEKMTPPRLFKDYNYAVLDFSMKVCTPRKPACETCPLSDDCSFYVREMVRVLEAPPMSARGSQS